MKKRRGAWFLPGLALGLLGLAVPGLAEPRIEKNLKLEPGGQFILDSDEGSVTIFGTSESGARVVISSNRDDWESLFDIRFEENPGMVRVTVRRTHRFGWPRNVSLNFDVRMPSETHLEVHTGGGKIEASSLRADAELNTSGGPITVSDLAASLLAHTSGGHIELRRVKGDARIDTSGGGIEVTSLRGSLKAHTSGGPIRVEGVEGRVDAKTSGGSVRVSFVRGNARGGEIETSGGSIHVRVDPSVNLSLDAETSGGSVVTDLPIRVVGRISSTRLEGSLGTGGAMLRLHTSGGSIHLEPI